jgi:hypothetical protein
MRFQYKGWDRNVIINLFSILILILSGWFNDQEHAFLYSNFKTNSDEIQFYPMGLKAKSRSGIKLLIS